METSKIDILSPFQKVLEMIVEKIPILLGFILFVLVSWIIIKIILWIVKKIITKANINKWSEKLNEKNILGNSKVKINLGKIIISTLKALLVLVFIMSGASIFGFDVISNGISNFFLYLPKLLTALAIFIGGYYLATVIKKTIKTMFKSLEIKGGNLVGNIAFYLIVIFLSITALDQAGIDTSIIKNNLTLLIGSILVSFTIAFGLGARDAVTRLLFGYYSRKNIGVGVTVKIGEIEGTVTAIDNISLTVDTEDGKVVLPIKDVVDNNVVIKK
ncbi:MAG: hypothetical protein KGV59_06500 [Tenacibaculum sp.]|nr:hypothetical protein [Tenacibaculum sp.]